MKQIFILVVFILSFTIKSQTFELKDKQLIKYYQLTNEAEDNIINNNLANAEDLYNKAFIEFNQPHAKDLYNSMVVSLKTNDVKTAYKRYQSLKCLGRDFDDNFFENNFKAFKKDTAFLCKNKIDFAYKNKLDSLVEIDQHYRNVSKGDYSTYQKELTKGDSITSINLFKLIQKKGFPNEYDLGLGSTNDMFYHQFYYIIWHQLATNSYSPQRVNFSKEIEKALNLGKIRPDIAAQLLDLNNGTSDYSYFKVMGFIKSDNTRDCCYVNYDFLPKNRTETSCERIQKVNKNRILLGLSSIEDEIQKKIFLTNNEGYVFTSITIESFQFQKEEDAEVFKKKLIKIDDITY